MPSTPFCRRWTLEGAVTVVEESELTPFDAAIALPFIDMSEQALESLGAPPPQSPAQVPTSAAWSSGGDSGSSDHAYGSHVEPAPLAPGEVFNPTVSYAFDEVRLAGWIPLKLSLLRRPALEWVY